MFSDNLKKYRKINKLSQKELAGLLTSLLNKSIEPANVRSWEYGTNPKLEVITALAEILDIPEQFLFDDSPQALSRIVSKEQPNIKTMVEHTKKVSLLNGYVGAGSSGIIDKIEVSKHLFIDNYLIKKSYQDKEVMALTVIGDSMTPYVDNQDVVLFHPIEKGQYNFIDGKYVIETMNGIMLKNITFKCNGEIVISSCNNAYSDETIHSHETQEHLDIIGIAVGRLLKS